MFLPPPPAILSSHQARNASPRVLLTRPVTLRPVLAPVAVTPTPSPGVYLWKLMLMCLL